MIFGPVSGWFERSLGTIFRWKTIARSGTKSSRNIAQRGDLAIEHIADYAQAVIDIS